jgi:hypothetical protein
MNVGILCTGRLPLGSRTHRGGKSRPSKMGAYLPVSTPALFLCALEEIQGYRIGKLLALTHPLFFYKIAGIA